ncbi:MAG: TolC family protein, partial [Phycisphaerae bacterium]|nr:TolC family protein [Phycisphaerae bacterium]
MKSMFVIAVLGVAMFVAGCTTQNSERPFAKYARDEYRSDYAHPQTSVSIELNENSGLNAYLAYAAQHNPGLEGAFNRWKAAVERIPQKKSLPDPRLTYRYYISEIETRVGPMRQTLGLSQTFPWLGKLELHGDVAAELAKAQRLRFEAARLKLFYEVKNAYCEYYYLWRSIAIVKENLQLVQRMEQVARTRYKTATTSHPDVIRAQVEIGKLEDRLKSLQHLRKPIMAKLNAALNRPPATELPWATELPQEQVSFTDEQMLTWASESNPELKAMDAETAAARYRTELAKKNYYPDVTLGVDYTDIGNSTGGRNPSDDGKDALAVMASINLPIWYNKLSAGVREARYRHWAATLNRHQRANDLNSTLRLALYHFHDAQRKVGLYRDTLLPKATESVVVSETAFRTGKASFTDLLDTQRLFLEFELAAERALANRAQRLAELEM